MTFPTTTSHDEAADADAVAAADKVLTFRKRRLSLPLHHLQAPEHGPAESPESPNNSPPAVVDSVSAATLAPPLLPTTATEDDKAHTFRKRRLSLTFQKPLASEHHEAEDDFVAKRRRSSSAASAGSAGSGGERLHPSRTLHASELLHDAHAAAAEKPDNILYHQKPLPAPAPTVHSFLSGAWRQRGDITASSKDPHWKRRHVHVQEHQLPFSKDIVGTYSCHGVEPVYDSDYEHDDDGAEAKNHNEWDQPDSTAAPIMPAQQGKTEEVAPAQASLESGQPPQQDQQQPATSVPEEQTTDTSSTAPSATATTASTTTTEEEEVEENHTPTTAAPPVPAVAPPISSSSSKPTTVAKINQDRGGVAFPYGNSPHTALFGVYDGHGQGGELVSQFCLTEVQRRLERHESFPTDLQTAFTEVFLTVDHALTREPLIEPLFAGTTACVALLRGQILTCANAGDSRAVLARRKTNQNGTIVSYDALDLTLDQTPDLPHEKQRILGMGGHVSPPPAPGLSARVWLDADCTQIGLAMARSIGDHAVSTVGVIAEPIVTQHEVDTDDEILLMASDGVWEFLSSQQAVDIVMANMDQGATKACQKLIEAAAARWHEEEGDYRDDITALVVRLQHLWDHEKTETSAKA